MAIKLQLRKQTGGAWEYVRVDVGDTVMSSKQHLFMKDTRIEFTEPYGNHIADYDLSETAIYDDTNGGLEETFTEPLLFQKRLIALQNPAFYDSTIVNGDVNGGTA